MGLLNREFGLPSLFFGGTPLPKKIKTRELLQNLPHFLIVYIFRLKVPSDFDISTHPELPNLELLPDNSPPLNDITLSFSMEMDMGKFLHPTAKKPETARHYKGSPTFYRLHGFVTQKDGMYMTYTRYL